MILTITKVEHKLTKAKDPFCKVTDVNNVEYTAWDASIIANLTAAVNKHVDVQVEESGAYKNIRGWNGFVDTPQGTTQIASPAPIVAKAPIVAPAAPVEVLEVPKQNSREYGKAGDRVKIYFDTAKDLSEQIAALRLHKLFPEEEKDE